MSKAFSGREKELIRKRLIEKGKELFTGYGLRKTGVRDLAKAAGIAQGSFYNFFQSKEELFFEIIEQEEEIIKEKLLSAHKADEDITGRSLRAFLTEAFKLIDESTFIKKLMNGEDYELMLRKLPEERMAKHIKSDSDILTPMLGIWHRKGVLIDRKPEVISGLLRGIFILSLHRKEIGEDVFPEVMELLIESVARSIIKEDGND
ncbi:MAG TPA: TetR/AcrR family transcriptional regulator [Bacillota bacterium]|mgnify:CR=1 FL=1|jgi:AcrR family transcriptional regulator|nr:TetR/AcrR family transcriptional regulator [Bacillota bacterium]HRS20933.1 TetR/AcrR family transcriptional regulator [Clostridia bacterium]HRU41467.1 TetR/AcrR family transcriptional regulator [Candidatus Diapherotrites archaeon]HQI15460.1 TetR/AcrR family transcriptional regulator [Bacillota bacterium]HQJ36998.1 TetR/AcrR family transcriptional regulator [Bacillota bacterium]